jgi:hypothetical protein
MSLPSFQHALCELIASPRLCLALRADPDAALARYELSARERKRLVEVVRQHGMSTNCTLYRSNRITPIYTLLHYTCLSLGAQFGPLVDQFWDAKEYQDGQFQSEVERFGAFLRQRVADGAVSSPFAGELLEFELAMNALEFGPRKELLRELASLQPPESDTPCRLHPLARIVRFRHDPSVLLAAAARGAMPAPDLPKHEALVVLSVVDGDLKVVQLPDGACRAFVDAATQTVEWLTPRLAPALADAGLLVPSLALGLHGSRNPIDDQRRDSRHSEHDGQVQHASPPTCFAP